MTESTALAIPGGVELTALTLADDTTYDEWKHAGQLLGTIEKGVQWWIADWMEFGETHFGEEYAQAVGELYKPETIRGFQWVAGKIPPERRIAELSFGHHRAVAALSDAEQDSWLGFAKADEWSVAELRKQIKGRGQAPEKPEEKAVECPFCQADLSEWLEKR